MWSVRSRPGSMRVEDCSRLSRWLLSSLLWLVSSRLCLVLPVVVVECCCRPVMMTTMCLPLLIVTVFVMVVEMMRMMRMLSRSLDMYLEVARYTSSHLTLSRIIYLTIYLDFVEFKV